MSNMNKEDFINTINHIINSNHIEYYIARGYESIEIQSCIYVPTPTFIYTRITQLIIDGNAHIRIWSHNVYRFFNITDKENKMVIFHNILKALGGI